jgi:hypothetical protein
MKSKSPSWRGKATVRPRRQGRRGLAFTGAKRKPLTEEADGSGAEFGQEGHRIGLGVDPYTQCPKSGNRTGKTTGINVVP